MHDSLCQNYYGHLNGTANLGLADETHPYRVGVIIHLPDLPVPSDEVVMR